MKTATKVTETHSSPDDVLKERKVSLGKQWEDLKGEEESQMNMITKANKNLERIRLMQQQIMRELMADEVITPELLEQMADEAIRALEETFGYGYLRHYQNDEFKAIETKLRENERALISVYKMVKAGSRPAAVNKEKDGRHLIIETFDQTLPERANCAYDRKAERRIGRENCNGNAVDQAEEMGIGLMTPGVANRYIHGFTDNDKKECYDYIQAPNEERENDEVLILVRGGGHDSTVLFKDQFFRSKKIGWRGMLLV